MQNPGFGSYEEIEPRRQPKPTSNFDIRPFTMVPEVSLIMDKAQKILKQTNDASPNIASDSRLSQNDASCKASESYALWKEKKYPQLSNTEPSPINKIYSSTQNSSGFQDNHSVRQSVRSCNTIGFKNYNSNNHYSGKPEIAENSNKYTSNYLVTHNDNNRYATNIDNYPVRSFNQDNRSETQGSRCLNERFGFDEKKKTEERWSDNKRILSNGEKRCGHSQAVETYDLIHKLREQRSSLYPNSNSHAYKSAPVNYDHHSNYRPIQQACNSQDHCYHQSPCCTGNHSNHNTSAETETVRNLLQVITSQNEQIKNLQKQLDRMIKLHEQNLKSRNQCTCQPFKNPSEIIYQNPHLYDQSRNIVQSNMLSENERCLSDMKLQDDRTKKTILEQKVSIGVMTSFELKVQNNPSTATINENKQKCLQEKNKQDIETSKMVRNLVSNTGEMIQKKNHYFTPTPLENISEGSESHLSSLRQSHLNPDSARQSTEPQDFTDQPGTKHKNPQNKKNTQVSSESDAYQNRRDKIIHRSPNSEYIEKQNQNSNNDNHIIQETPYEYDFQFKNIPSSPQENSPTDNLSDELNPEPLTANVTKIKHTKSDNHVDECLSLSESELDVEDPGPPSPEPSIHLDMQEFSSDGGSLPPQQPTKAGWTLYNNVIDEVNQILENSPAHENQERESPDDYQNNEKRDCDSNFIIDTVKAATIEQLTKLGISFSENVDQRKLNGNKRVMFDECYYPKHALPEVHLATTSSSLETNTSVHMQALARKYFNEEQMTEIAVQKGQTGPFRPTNFQNSNISFATLHYLQRYHLLPGSNSNPAKEIKRDNRRPTNTGKIAAQKADRRTTESTPRRDQGCAGSSKVSFPSKILDISTLKQQPKLL